MCDSRHPTVTGLVPRAVRIELEACQAQLLVNELVSRIETKAGSLREDHERHGSLSPAALSDANDWLLEYRNLLDALNAEPDFHRPAATVLVTASAVVADALVRACAARSVELLDEQLPPRSGEIARLRAAGTAAAAWAQTLADLRELDEDAPDTILD